MVPYWEVEPQKYESHRVDVLHRYGLLDTLPESELDEIVATAAKLCDAPVALITLLDEDRQWFKAKVGIDIPESPRAISFCAHALQQRNLLVVPDAAKDPRFAASPLVAGPEHVRFYAGAPLITPEQTTLGTLCVLDRKPRQLTRVQERSLEMLASQVMAYFEEHRRQRELKFDDQGRLSPGIHEFTLEQLQRLVCTNNYRIALWHRLVSFLAWPIVGRQFSYAYIGGGFLSNKVQPQDIDVILQTAEPYGAASFAAMNGFFRAGLDEILKLHSVHLHFWMEGAPEGLSDFRSFFQYQRPNGGENKMKFQKWGIAQLDLRAPDIVAQFQRAVAPLGK